MLNDSFCSSPWFHIKIDANGNYLPCRWGTSHGASAHNIRNTSLAEYIDSQDMRNIRTEMLEGIKPAMCSACGYEDSNNKVSGRQKQLLKSAITIKEFDKTFCSSPHWPLFEQSANNHGHSNYQPADLQIDLGNMCNSACIMCSPTYSSKLATEYVKLNIIDSELFPLYPPIRNWSDDSELVEKFVNEIVGNPNIKYIHFLGGETLYLKSFYTICDRLIELGHSKNISIGTTTNCTVYSPQLENIIKQFKHVHLGLSIESAHVINDYIRWPSAIEQIQNNIKKFLELRNQTNLHLSLRITPNILSIFHIDTIFELMLDQSIIAESCNILHEPGCLRIELLPKELIDKILIKINTVISAYNLKPPQHTILNRRRDDLIDPVIADVIFEYLHLLENYQLPADVEQQRYDLVKFLKSFEIIRNNSILNYLPEYEEFLRSYGY